MPPAKKTNSPRTRPAAWLAPLTVSEPLKKRLENQRFELSLSLGVQLTKAQFVRMLLERGLRSLEERGKA